jgi:hypothetical protein
MNGTTPANNQHPLPSSVARCVPYQMNAERTGRQRKE